MPWPNRAGPVRDGRGSGRGFGEAFAILWKRYKLVCDVRHTSHRSGRLSDEYRKKGFPALQGFGSIASKTYLCRRPE